MNQKKEHLVSTLIEQIQTMNNRFKSAYQMVFEDAKVNPSMEAVTLMEQMNNAISQMELVLVALEDFKEKGQPLSKTQNRELEEMLMYFDEAITPLESIPAGETMQ